MGKVVCELKKSSYENTHTYEDGKILTISFLSKDESLTDDQIKKADFLLDRLSQRFTADNISISDIVKILRKTFEGVSEERLTIEIKEKKTIETKEKSTIVMADYIQGALDYYYCDFFTFEGKEITIPSDFLKIWNKISNKIELFDRNIKNINIRNEFTKEEKNICMIFKYFFGENPDFWLQKNMDKTQLLIHVLKPFGIVVNSDWGFYSSDELPYSIGLSLIMKDLALFGPTPIDTNELDEKTKQILDLIKFELEINGYNNERFTDAMINIIKSKNNQFDNRHKDDETKKTQTMIENINKQLRIIMTKY